MQLRLRVSHEVVDSLLLAGLRAAAAGHGVTVRDVSLALKAREGRAASFKLAVTASKSVLLVPVSLTVEVERRFVIDDRFRLTLYGLSARSEGVVGWVVDTLGIIRSRVEVWEGRTFNLRRFFPGLRLQDVAIASGASTLSLAADFAG